MDGTETAKRRAAQSEARLMGNEALLNKILDTCSENRDTRHYSPHLDPVLDEYRKEALFRMEMATPEERAAKRILAAIRPE